MTLTLCVLFTQSTILCFLMTFSCEPLSVLWCLRTPSPSLNKQPQISARNKVKYENNMCLTTYSWVKFSWMFRYRIFCVWNYYFCILCTKPFEASNHELNMAFNLTKPKVGLICLHYVTWKVLWPFTDHFADALFAKTLNASMTLWRRSDVQKFDADAILFREIQFKKRDI